MTAEDALKRMQDGNRRFVERSHEYAGVDDEQRKAMVSDGQNPFACVLSCSDSRVPSEHIFDCGFGDLFMVRVAGNVVHPIETGSVEFALLELDVPLVVVLGHTHCGAVTAAVSEETAFGAVRLIVDRILPSVHQAQTENKDADKETILNSAIRKNVFKSMEDLLLGTMVVRRTVRVNRMELHGAIYDIETGTVEWLGEHPRQREWLELG